MSRGLVHVDTFPLQVFSRVSGSPDHHRGHGIQGGWYPTQVYVDSGAAFTVLRAQIARGIGFDYRKGERIYTQVGDGSYIPVYLHDLEIQLGGERFIGKVGFSEKLGVAFNLLGRMSIFDQFKICFLEPQGLITFER